DIGSWRLVFYSIVPFALIAAWIAFQHGKAATDNQKKKPGSLDYAGALLVTLGLAGIVGALIAGPASGFTSLPVIGSLSAGLVLLAGFVLVERRATTPLLPLEVFRSRILVGANLNTLLVYAALTGLFFLLMLQLQNGLGYSALKAGSSLLPINVLLLVMSPKSGNLAERIGARVMVATGSAIAAVGMLLFIR